MNPNRLRAVARRLAAGPRAREPDTTPDAELLARFLDRHDEAAFGELVARHLPAVRAACRSVLRDPNDVDDAAQATFLVLVRRAGTVRDRAALGGWLYRVAWRVANRLRKDNARRAATRQPGVDPDAIATPAAAPPPGGDVAAVVREEVGRLPERYQLAVLACYAGGSTTAEAAARLGCPRGTLLTRLAWAKKRLRDRLTKRGVTLAGGLAAAVGEKCAVATAVSAARIAAVATGVVAGDPAAKGMVSERVSSLTEGAVHAMAGTKLKCLVALAVVAVALVGIGLGRFTADASDRPGPVDKKAKEVAAKPVAEPAAEHPNGEAEVAQPAGPGDDLVVRRPRGSFTREVPPFGRATLTFTENRLHLHATVNVDKFSLVVSADADYSINRESVVYGVISGADISSPGGGEAGIAVAPLAAVATDMPFAFRVRVEDDAITIKDLKAGPFGSPMLMELFGKGDSKDLAYMTSLVCGKYKADATPDRNPPAAPRGNVPAPKLRRQSPTANELPAPLPFPAPERR